MATRRAEAGEKRKPGKRCAAGGLAMTGFRQISSSQVGRKSLRAMDEVCLANLD